MKFFGVVGWSGSGKTTLLVSLLADLIARGLRVSTIKHTHHALDLDRPGKDTFRHREAGATEVVLLSSSRWTLMHELRGMPEPTPQELESRLAPVDLVLAEGFKQSNLDKLEVFRPALGQPPLYPSDPSIVAVASDVPIETSPLPCLPLVEPGTIARFIIRHCRLSLQRVEHTLETEETNFCLTRGRTSGSDYSRKPCDRGRKDERAAHAPLQLIITTKDSP
jgi:molybdopterin-guanine dinucleotide biosynthesis adapter protein